MNFSAVDIQEARAQSVTVIKDALTVDLRGWADHHRAPGLVPSSVAWHTSGAPVILRMFGDGAYIHWPDLDEDLTVAGLLARSALGREPSSLAETAGGPGTRRS